MAWLRPDAIAKETRNQLIAPYAPQLDGFVPGFGRFSPCPWGLGPEVQRRQAPLDGGLALGEFRALRQERRTDTAERGGADRSGRDEHRGVRGLGDEVVADLDECDANVGAWFVSPSNLRVGLDLDGSLESLGNSMTDLADALDRTGECDLVRFRSRTSARAPNETRLALRALWSPLWRRSLGRSIDTMLPHARRGARGRDSPRRRRSASPLIISVDDLRPLRGETTTHLRIDQLRRAVQRGATLVASSRSASHEVISVLGVARNRVVVVPPAVPLVEATLDGTDLVVNITGVDDLFIELAPQLIAFATAHGSRVVALASTSAAQKIRSSGLAVTVRPRQDARDALANARVVMHLSDGARFPSFAIAALSAGVPTIARATEINRELLEGAAALFANDHEVRDALDEVWTNGERRSIMVAAGRSRAVDFAPDTAARAYLSLYHEVVRGWSA